MEHGALDDLDRAALVELLLRERAEHQASLAALQQQVAALQQQVVELQARLGQNSSNSSRPPSSDPPGTRRPPQAAPGARRAGGQPGHPGHHRALLPPERVDRWVPRVPAACRQCGGPLAAEAGPDDPSDERHQVLELPPLALEVTEYRLAARRCGQCGGVTRAELPTEVGGGWFGPRLQAVVTATLTVFLIAPRRTGAVARTLLGAAWRGIVGSDRFSGYAWLPVCWRQVCWAHLKRDFQALVDRGGAAAPIGEAALAVEREVFVLWHRFRRGEVDRPALQRAMEAHQTTLWRVLVAGRTGQDRKAAGLCRKLLDLWPALWTFVRVDGVEPTNNAAEQALRPAVLWRKGSFGCHSAAGSRFAERMLTVAASCRQQQRNLLEFLAQANHAARLGSTPPSLVLRTG